MLVYKITLRNTEVTHVFNRFNDWTGPLAHLSMFSIKIVDKVRLRTGNTAFPVKFSPMKVRQQRVKVKQAF